MGVNRVEASDGRTIIDISNVTATETNVFAGETFYGSDGEQKNGTFTISDEISNQNTLIEQIEAALDGKASGGINPTGTIEINQNGTYDVAQYASAEVDVPSRTPNIQPLSVTDNGVYTAQSGVDGYSPITVNVQSSGGGSDAEATMAAIIDRTVTSLSSNATKLGDYAFRNCTRLATANLPEAISIGQYAFKYCNALKNVYIPKATTLSAYAFEDSGIQKLDLPVATSIAANAINGTNLSTLIIRTSKVCTLANKNALGDTPIEDGTGYIYVPASLVDSYKAASNWSTYAARFRAIEDYPDITGG